MFRFSTAFRRKVDKVEKIQNNDRKTGGCLAEKIKEESGGNLLSKRKLFKKEDTGQEILGFSCSKDIYIRF